MAEDAQSQLIGKTKEQILACMGPPMQKAAEGQTEVWSYASGNGRTTITASGQSNTAATAFGSRNYATGQATTYGSAVAVGTRRFCTVNIVITKGMVAAVNYVGPTGGVLSRGEQCAFAIESCLR